MANGEATDTQLAIRVEALEHEFTELRQALSALTREVATAADGTAMTTVLDSIPGAFERLQQRQAQIDQGKTELIPLENL